MNSNKVVGGGGTLLLEIVVGPNTTTQNWLAR